MAKVPTLKELEEELERDLKKRKRFIQAYLVLRDPVKAAQKVALHYPDLGERYLQTRLVATKIARAEYEFLTSKSEDETLIQSLKWEAMYGDTASARLGAKKELVKLRGLKDVDEDKEIKVFFIDTDGLNKKQIKQIRNYIESVRKDGQGKSTADNKES